MGRAGADPRPNRNGGSNEAPGEDDNGPRAECRRCGGPAPVADGPGRCPTDRLRSARCAVRPGRRWPPVTQARHRRRDRSRSGPIPHQPVGTGNVRRRPAGPSEPPLRAGRTDPHRRLDTGAAGPRGQADGRAGIVVRSGQPGDDGQHPNAVVPGRSRAARSDHHRRGPGNRAGRGPAFVARQRPGPRWLDPAHRRGPAAAGIHDPVGRGHRRRQHAVPGRGRHRRTCSGLRRRRGCGRRRGAGGQHGLAGRRRTGVRPRRHRGFRDPRRARGAGPRAALDDPGRGAGGRCRRTAGGGIDPGPEGRRRRAGPDDRPRLRGGRRRGRRHGGRRIRPADRTGTDALAARRAGGRDARRHRHAGDRLPTRPVRSDHHRGGPAGGRPDRRRGRWASARWARPRWSVVLPCA